MLNFKYSFLMWLSATFCVAADIDLTGGSKLSGRVLAMDGKGVMTLASPLADQPLRLNLSHLEEVDFQTTEESVSRFHQRLTLVNGDSFPVAVVSLAEGSLETVASGIGRLDIPKSLIDSLQLGLYPQETIYSGPTDFRGWLRDSSGSRNWSLNDGAFRINGGGNLSREVDFPENYIIRFRLGWQSNPDFKFVFADTLDGRAKRDRYVLEFDASGLDIKREAAGAKRSSPIAVVGRDPATFHKRQMTVEIRVNHLAARLELHINGQLMGRYVDPVPDPPSGSLITFSFEAGGENVNSLDRFEITEWDERSDRYRSEDRGDTGMDSIIDRFGDRFGGELLSIASRDEGKVYRFKSEFHEEPIELSGSEVSTLFFAKDSKAEVASGGLVLHLTGGGSIHATECEFGEETIRMIHPLLGAIELERSSVKRLARAEAAKQGKGGGEP